MANEFHFQDGYGTGNTDSTPDTSSSGQFHFQSGYGSNSTSPSSAPGLMQSIKDVQSRPELQPINSLVPTPPTGNPLQQVLGSMKQVASFPLRMGATVNQIPEAGGEGLAAWGLAAGYPKTGAALGTMVSEAPLAAGLVSGGAALDDLLKSSENPAIIRAMANTPKMLSPEYEAQDQALGVTRELPQTGGQYPTYEDPYEYPSQFNRRSPVMSGPKATASPLPSEIPARYPSKPADFFSYANGRLMNAPESIQPQELMDWQTKLSDDIATNKIPQFDKDGNTTTAFQQAADIKSRASDLFNQMADQNLPLLRQEGALPQGIPDSRTDLNSAYGLSKTFRSPIASTLPPPVIYYMKKYAPQILEGLGFGTGVGLSKR